MLALPKNARQVHKPPTRCITCIVATWLLTGATAVAQPADGTLGRVEGGEVLSLGTSATGTIAEIMVSAGERVRAGQHLVQVECGAIARDVEARKSEFAAAEAAHMRTLHGSRVEEINIGVANVNLANARFQEAEKAFQRTKQLREGVTVTRVQLDQAERDARIAAALLDEMRAKLALLQAGSREEDITEARARRDAAKARMDEAAARLGYCTVDAPASGIVLATHVSAGQLVSTIAPITLVTMVDDSKRRVRAYVDERDVEKLCPGERARVSAEGIPGQRFDGVVETIGLTVGESPLTTNASRQFRQITLALAENQKPAIGLRVSVQFLPCPPGSR
jgi:multidrug resistance efflux pump